MSARVGDLALLVVQLVLDDADRHAEEPVEPAHPLGVAAGQVVVDGDDVDALAVERVQVGGQRGDERLAFAGLHLGDPAAVQDDAADQLHVEVPHVQHAAAGLADDRERLGQQIVERLAVGEPLRGTRPSSRAAARRRAPAISGSFALISATHRPQPLQVTLVLRADDLREESVNNHQGRIRSGYPLIVQGRDAKGKGAGCGGPRYAAGPQALGCAGRAGYRPARSLSGLVSWPLTQHFVVEVRARRAAGRADVADDVAAVDLLAGLTRRSATGGRIAS